MEFSNRNSFFCVTKIVFGAKTIVFPIKFADEEYYLLKRKNSCCYRCCVNFERNFFSRYNVIFAFLTESNL